ncbi:hypothetical protein Tco_0231807 [Tanacetum coccineum]
MSSTSHQPQAPAQPQAFGLTGPFQQAQFGSPVPFIQPGPPGSTPPIVASQFQQPVGMVFLNYGISPSYLPQATILPQAFQTMTLQEPNWNIDTGASSNLAENTVRQFTRDNNVSVDFDAYGFSVKDYQTRQLLLCCDSTDDLYPVTQQPSTTTTFAFLSLEPHHVSRRPGYPSEECKHTRLPFYSSESSVASVFDIIHSDLWPSQVKVFNVDIKALQCDHGSEYDNTRFHNLFGQNGM